MEEELSENELENQMYYMLNHADEIDANVNDDSNKKNDFQFDVLPRCSNVRRYWHTSEDQYTPYRKFNSIHTLNNSDKQKSKPQDVNLKSNPQSNQTKTKPQELNQPKPKPLVLDQAKSKPSELLQSATNTQENLLTKGEKVNIPEKSDLSIFQHPVPNNLKKTIEILDNDDDRIVDLQSSDEDEVIEVALPPKPTITIESSDDEVCAVPIESPSKDKNIKQPENRVTSDRAVSSSPAPSIVSSVSDEFIRGDCIALNISSRHPNNESFDFSLHGSDLLVQTPSKKKKRKKNKDTASSTSTPIQNQTVSINKNTIESCFATPKSKAKKKKKLKPSNFKCTEIIIPPADVYDSDSNHSLIGSNKNTNSYTVTEKSLPSTDVYESDSNQSEQQKEQKKDNNTEIESSDSSMPEKVQNSSVTPAEDFISLINHSDLVDLTAPDIDENIVMANVTGFSDDNLEESFYHSRHDNTTKLGSTNIPAILCEDLDFDNLKGNTQICKGRRYSLTTLRAEMEKFYNESWGGENFNHREIQKNMSRDKSLWVIDPKDKMPQAKRRVTCNYCNRPGHRDDACRAKPPVCYMCGSTGHYEPRCPRKICVNCGSPNHIYSNMCRNCSSWRHMRCAECGQGGHPASHCPDVWRRYHNTIDFSMTLEENRQTKRNQQHFCSGCTRRGHLVHTCRISIPFSGLPINSPYVNSYKPIYPFIPNNNINLNKQFNKNSPQDTANYASTQKMDRNKRQSKSPVVHETHQPKRRSISLSCDGINTKSPLNTNHKNTQNQANVKNPNEASKIIVDNIGSVIENDSSNKSSNHDDKGQMIQDNEVSDTSEVITSARIYLTKEIKEALITDDGKAWLDDAKLKNHVTLDNNDIDSPFLSVRGSVGNQEAFQSELREWTKSKQLNISNVDPENSNEAQSSDEIPKNKNALLRKLSKSLNSLKKFLGDPSYLYKELMFHQNRRGQLLKQKVISSAALGNNRDNIKGMLKKLNMVLLGQAGLADGVQHLQQLYLLQEKITNLRQQNVSKPLRDEIGKHFHCIFSALPRDDYAELVQKYNCIQNKSSVYKKKNKNVFKVSPKPNTGSMLAVNTVQKKKDTINVDLEITDKTTAKAPNLKKVYRKLIFCHRRLLNSRPADSSTQRTRQELEEKLRTSIATLGKLNHMTPKTKKRMRKIQQEAQSFLSTA